MQDDGEARYRALRLSAYARSRGNVRHYLGEEARFFEFAQSTEEVWRGQWLPTHRRPPNGGWDWPQIMSTYKARAPARFELAVWNQDISVLCGLAIGEPKHDRLEVAALESNPNPRHPLACKVLPAILDAATCYAQTLGKTQLLLADPVNDKIISLYCETYGFRLERDEAGRPYCIREV